MADANSEPHPGHSEQPQPLTQEQLESIEHSKQQKWKTRAYEGVAIVTACVIIWGVLQICGVLWQAVATVITTALIAFLLHGIVNWFEEHGLSRMLGTAITMLVFIAVLLGAIGALIPTVATQVSAFAANAPQYANELYTEASALLSMLPLDGEMVSSLYTQAATWLQEQFGGILQGLAGGVVEGVMGVGNGVLVFFIALICSFWILIDLPKLSQEALKLFNPRQQETVHIVADAFGTAVYGWAKATLLCAIISGVANGVFYWLLGMPYAALLGFVCGLLYFVPYVGPMVAAVAVALVGLLVSPLICVVALVVNIVVNNVVANIVSPKLMKSSVNVHPALIMIVILIGGALGGAVGMLFSIPIAAAIQGVFITFFEKRTGKELATEDGVLFQKPKVAKIPTIDTAKFKPHKGSKE